MDSQKFFSVIFALLSLSVWSVRARAEGLRDVAAQKGVSYGCATTTQHLLRDAAFNAAFAKQCGVLVPETEMKMSTIAVAPQVYNFAPVDWLTVYAQRHGMSMRGHTLVWWKKVPAWLPAHQARAFMQDYIRTVVGRYPQIRSWDVVNEAVTRPDNFWSRAVGADYIDLAFRTARQANPSAELVYNDYGLETDRRKQEQVLGLLRGLQQRGVPVDALGVQGHLTAGRTNFRQFVGFCQQVQGLGLAVLVTELEVRGANKQAVAETYTAFTAAALSCGVRTLVTWGRSDTSAWLTTQEPAMRRSILSWDASPTPPTSSPDSTVSKRPSS
jgi:endo-1,4-beta-xylanase